MQRLYLIPVVNDVDMAEECLGNVCGDSQCGSPRHTTKHLCYFLMELIRSYILEVELNDKCYVKFV